jgi:hypothetical protein
MAATEDGKRFPLVALVLCLVAIGLLVADKISNPDIAHRHTFDVLQLIFAAVALVLGVVVLLRARHESADDDDHVIDLRERLGGFVDLDDVDVDRAMDAR